MKWMLWYGLALAALVAVVLRRDHVTPEPSGKYDGRVTILGADDQIELHQRIVESIDWFKNVGFDAVGQIAPEGMLK